VARSYMIPRTQDELLSISKAMRTWLKATHGIDGPAADYINRAMSGYAGGAGVPGRSQPRFAENTLAYHEYLPANGICA